MGDQKTKTIEITPNFNVDVVYVENEHSGKKIPTIIDVIHEKVSIFEIVKVDVVSTVRSEIFKQINGYV